MSFPLRSVCLALAAMLLCSCAIGVKEWPKAQEQEDEFAWQGLIATRQDSCLILDGMLSGNHANLSAIRLQLEAMGDGVEEGYGCFDCPFTVRRTETVRRGDPKLSMQGAQFTMTVCGLEPERAYRFRVVADNVFTNLEPQATDVALIRP